MGMGVEVVRRVRRRGRSEMVVEPETTWIRVRGLTELVFEGLMLLMMLMLGVMVGMVEVRVVVVVGGR